MDIAGEMKARADAFRTVYGEYFRGRIAEKELTQSTTQPFWQSMRLSKRRLEEKGLSLDVKLFGDQDKALRGRGAVSPAKDGYNYTGISTRPVLTERCFRKNGKIIYKKKEHEISNVSLIKSQVEGDSAACPNCGHIGKITSYIDGCDYCDSKFLVSDFETKISGFSLEENEYKTVKRLFNRTFMGLCLISFLLVLVLIAAGATAVLLYMSGGNGTEALMSAGIMMYAFDSIPVYFRILFYFVLFYFFGRGSLMLLYRRVISGEELVKCLLPDFSVYDFYQNLEYQLRSIHLTGSADKVRSFAAFDLQPVVERYGDVVDCALTGLKILTAREIPGEGRCVVEVQARVKLILCCGNKIKIKYERLYLELSGTYEMLKHNCNAIREYKCPGCGGSVDVLSGGKCEFCGNRLDYSRYGWLIQRYETGKRFQDTRKLVQGLAVLFFLLIALGNAAHFLRQPSDDSASWGQVFQILAHSGEFIESYFQSVPKPSEIDGSVVLFSADDSDLLEKTYLYETENAEQTFRDYVDYLTEMGCSGSASFSENPFATMYMSMGEEEAINYQRNENGTRLDFNVDYSAWAIIEISIENGYLKLRVELTDEI